MKGDIRRYRGLGPLEEHLLHLGYRRVRVGVRVGVRVRVGVGIRVWVGVRELGVPRAASRRASARAGAPAGPPCCVAATSAAPRAQIGPPPPGKG